MPEAGEREVLGLLGHLRSGMWVGALQQGAAKARGPDRTVPDPRLD